MKRGAKPKERRTPEGARLYALRTGRGMTLAEASAKWGITEQCLSRYELGYELAKSSAALRIARLEGVSLDWLYALSDERERV